MRYYLTVLTLCAVFISYAQPYSLDQLEASFLQRNYLVIAEKFEISKAEAEIVQEKVWENPTLAISEVNLWTNPGGERMTPMFGSWGETQQISVGLEQLIETAGKRKKRVAIKRLEHRIAVYEFEELVRELKKELRQTFYQLSSVKYNRSQLMHIVQLFEQMKNQYDRQASQQNITKADYFRVNNELASLRKDLIDLEADMETNLSKLRMLTRLSDLELDQLQVNQSFTSRTILLPADIKTLLAEQNIAIQKQAVSIKKAEGELTLERANRKPDMTVGMEYDRGGNIMQDFIGLNLSIDLPIFNRNKGNIQKARYQLDQEKVIYEGLQSELEEEVNQYKKQLLGYENMLNGWENAEPQEKMMESYHKHLLEKQVTLMEFIDYVQSHREAQESYVAIWEDYNLTFEELQYLLGKDF